MNINKSAETKTAQQPGNSMDAQYMKELLVDKMGTLSQLEMEVLESIRHGELLTSNIETRVERDLRALDRMADEVAALVGSWSFPLAIVIFLVVWIVGNILFRPFEPYPTIITAIIGAVLATLGALHGPIILMSQRRQNHRDRLQAAHDYQVNLKAELEIRSLHEKMDRVLASLQDDR